jgi:putative heme-binding domain-containing protein
MRVREKAQFELADRSAVRTLLAAAKQTGNRLGRFHGIWGIGQVARRDARQAALLLPFLKDSDAEVRAQAAKTLGDLRDAAAAPQLVALLKDPEARPRFFAAEALGRIGYHPAVQPLIEMLRENDDRDVYLRSAGTIALARIGEAEPLLALASSPSKALRVDAVVTLRRLGNPGVARFLQDADEYVVTEAARAINDDGSIEQAVPALAALLGTTSFHNEALLRREVNANLRVGTAEAAQRVASFAAASGGPEVNRVDAIAALGVWPEPSVLDRVDGYSHGPVERDSSIARNALAPIVAPLLSGGTTAVKVAAAEAAGRLRIAGAGDALFASAKGDAAPEVRIAALQALRAIGDRRTEEAIRTALADRDQTVRMTALGLVSGLDLPADRSAQLLGSVLGHGSLIEQQSALAELGRMNSASAQGFLNGMLDQYAVGKLTPGLELEVEEAIAAGGTPAQRTRLAGLQAAHKAGDLIAGFRDALFGGNAQRGARVVFQGNGQCTRCHSIGQRGADVGPNLRGVGSRLDRETLLQELVVPNARLAPGFGTVVVTLKSGDRVAGSPKSETDSELVLQTGDATRTIPKSQIAQRSNASPMPPMGGVLSHRELRDVVEFLSTLK